MVTKGDSAKGQPWEELYESRSRLAAAELAVKTAREALTLAVNRKGAVSRELISEALRALRDWKVRQ